MKHVWNGTQTFVDKGGGAPINGDCTNIGAGTSNAEWRGGQGVIAKLIGDSGS